MTDAARWYVGFWLTYGADALPWLAGLGVVVGVVLVAVGLALRLLTRALWYGGLALGVAGIVRAVRRRKKRDFYHTYLGSAAWDAQRVAALRRAGFRCSYCKRSVPLDVHHLTYERLGHEAPADLVALCRRCHSRAHAVDAFRARRVVARVPRIPATKYPSPKRGR